MQTSDVSGFDAVSGLLTRSQFINRLNARLLAAFPVEDVEAFPHRIRKKLPHQIVAQPVFFRSAPARGVQHSETTDVLRVKTVLCSEKER